MDDLDALIAVLPERVSGALEIREDLHDLLEVVLDLGRLPEARFPGEQFLLDEHEVTDEDIRWVIDRVGTFGDDNRAGIERTLHRISVIRNRQGRPVGLTCRVGRAVFGTIRVIDDIARSGESILLMGKPGVGKTTMLREIARVLSDEAGKRVIIVDTSNEIAGDGDVPHPAIGSARRMQVPSTPLQHHVMIEAVENHMPEVIIIDEMSTELEALAARTIAERGVQLIATAHGNTLSNLVSNPSLSDLVGGTHTVTLGDEEARRRRTQKTILERKQRPTFGIVVEIHDWRHVGVHREVGHVVDDMLRGLPVAPELRWFDEDGGVHRERPEPESALPDPFQPPRFGDSHPSPVSPAVTRVYPFGIPRPMLESQVARAGAPVEIVGDIDDADLLLTTKAHYGRRPAGVRLAEKRGMPVYVLRKGSMELIDRFLQRYRGPSNGDNSHHDDRVEQAMLEVKGAVRRVLAGERRVELAPQAAYIRRLQHGLANQFKVGSSSFGADPARRVVLRQRRR